MKLLKFPLSSYRYLPLFIFSPFPTSPLSVSLGRGISMIAVVFSNMWNTSFFGFSSYCLIYIWLNHVVMYSLGRQERNP